MAATLDQQAAYVIQSTALALAAGVERYAIYKAVDEKPDNDADLYGLVRNDRSLKPAYLAYQVTASYSQDVQSAVYNAPRELDLRRSNPDRLDRAPRPPSPRLCIGQPCRQH